MIYELYNQPDWLTYELMDDIILHAHKTLKFPRKSKFVIEFTNDIKGQGDCDGHGKTIEINIKRKLSKKTILVTLFHELVHAEQILSGRLTIIDGLTSFKWYDTIFESTYHESPWEIEAYRLEKVLMGTFSERSNQCN